ncbi:uncharacterized protein LOC108098720 [Drosophila ficusphila]|uniref:uncharacterized protein LOC108098720 n=1 Tax=Drosophila ficusphila TaxID=30025 RepID=UPI0007E6BCF8|nr:uncharacterized protein LOC108098720 [Drosophila ficusphila]
MEELVEIGAPYLYIMGIPAELYRHWEYVGGFLSQEEFEEHFNEPNLEIVSLQQMNPHEVNSDFQVVPSPPENPEEPPIDLTAAGDGLHVIPQPSDDGDPAWIIFRPSRRSTHRMPWFSLGRLVPAIIAFFNALFKKMVSLLGFA